MRYYDGPHHGTPVLPWLFFAAFLVLIALAAYALVRGSQPRPAALPAEGDALAILRLRYARGELNREEFLQATADLGGAPPPS